MSGAGRGRKAKAGLTSDEQALWDHAARSMQRLIKTKDRVLDGADAFLEAMEAGETPVKRRVKPDKPSAKSLPGLPTVPVESADQGRTRVPPIADFDRKSAKRLRSGQIDIEARLDLHGMRQDGAQDALRSFLLSCHVRGLRWVLVITGKGAPRRTGWGSGEDGGDWVDRGERSEPGVLRRRVPRWLEEPDIRALVVSYTQAASQHGGEGAIYVQLRRRG